MIVKLLDFFSETGICKIMVYNDYMIIIEFICECKLIFVFDWSLILMVLLVYFVYDHCLLKLPSPPCNTFTVPFLISWKNLPPPCVVVNPGNCELRKSLNLLASPKGKTGSFLHCQVMLPLNPSGTRGVSGRLEHKKILDESFM